MIWIKRAIVALIVLGALGAGAWYVAASQSSSTSAFATAAVTRGELLATISATGTVEPEEVVDVGAQVAGQILEFGKDSSGKTVDYGSAVEAGTVLARIDPTTYQADVSQAQAQLAQAQAGVTRALADVEQMRAKLFQAQRDWDRAKNLGPSDALSQADYDAAQAAFEVAKANVGVSEAMLEQDKQAVKVAQATVDRAQRNLDYTTITSPVKGVIIDRRVNIGQTVVSSLSAPSLFLIAKDLKRMQVWAPVNEADIGSVRSGQPVSFTVDAYPGQAFMGQVNKIRLNASMTQNVVTYTVEVTTDNSSGKLLPYLTANVKFEVSRHDDVLLVPNAALRFSPRANQIAPNTGPDHSSGATTLPAQGGERKRWRDSATTSASNSGETMTRGVIWVPDGKYVKPASVRVGASDGITTEIQGAGVSEGMQVVIGEQQRGSTGGASSGTSGESTNPFVPQMPGRGRGGGGGGPAGGGGGGGGRRG